MSSTRACTDPVCPAIKAALELLGRPWSGLILTALEDGPLRFSELSARVGDIGDRMLACRLKELEASGVISRNVEAATPVRIEYALTEAGRGFGEVTKALQRWGQTLAALPLAAPGGCPAESADEAQAATAQRPSSKP